MSQSVILKKKTPATGFTPHVLTRFWRVCSSSTAAVVLCCCSTHVQEVAGECDRAERLVHGKVQLSRQTDPYKSRTCQIHTPQAKESSSSSSHPYGFARARTNAANLATDSAHQHARTHNPSTNPPTHPIAMDIQRYSRTAAAVFCCDVHTYSSKQAKGMFGTVPACPVPVRMSCRTYLSVRYRY